MSFLRRLVRPVSPSSAERRASRLSQNSGLSPESFEDLGGSVTAASADADADADIDVDVDNSTSGGGSRRSRALSDPLEVVEVVPDLVVSTQAEAFSRLKVTSQQQRQQQQQQQQQYHQNFYDFSFDSGSDTPPPPPGARCPVCSVDDGHLTSCRFFKRGRVSEATNTPLFGRPPPSAAADPSHFSDNGRGLFDSDSSDWLGTHFPERPPIPPDVPDLSSDDPLATSCPYMDCGKVCSVFEFPLHAMQRHSDLAPNSHRYHCPVCLTLDPSSAQSYQIGDNTNLLSHLQSNHAELIESALGSAFADGDGGESQEERRPSQGHPAMRSLWENYDPSLFDDDYDSSLFGADALNSNGDGSRNSGVRLTRSIEVDLDSFKSSIVGSGHLAEQTVALEGDPLEGRECEICFEEFVGGETLARLECFCIFHNHCIKDWFAKSDNRCPTHKDDLL